MCDHKHVTFLGKQPRADMPPLRLYNCDYCHTTLAYEPEDIADRTANWITRIGFVLVVISAAALLIYNLVRQ